MVFQHGGKYRKDQVEATPVWVFPLTMATSKLATSDDEDDITKCPICFEVFIDPKYLPCLHTFCRSCLQSYLLSGKEIQSGFYCPVCRTFVSTKSAIPEEILKEIPVNHLIVRLLDKKQIIENTKMCEPCGKRTKQINASHWCNDCCEALCGECVSFHNSMKALSGHRMLPMNELKNKSLNIPIHYDYCDSHKGKKLEIYCFDHETPCCLTCMTVHHRKCEKVTTIDEAAKGIKENPDTLKLLEDFENMAVECENVIHCRSENLKSLEEEKDELNIKVTMARENIDKHLDTLEKELRDNVDASHKEHALSLEDQKTSYENTMKMAQNYRKVLSSCIQSVPDTQTLVEINKLRKSKQKCEEIMKRDSAKLKDVHLELTLHKNIEQFNRQCSSFGTVHVNTTLSCHVSPNLKECLFNVNLSAVSLLESIGKLSTCITGGTCLLDGRLVFADNYLKKLLIYDANLTRKADIPLANKPWDVVHLETDKVAVTLPDEHCIQIINTETKRSEKTVAVGKWCHGIVYRNGVFIVACKSEVVKVDIDGSIIQTILLKHSDVQYITSIGDNMIYTSNSNSSVQIIGQNGDELFQYQYSKLMKPAGIQIDNQGNVYVAGRGSCDIYQFDPSGKLIRILFKNDDIKRPQFILFANDNRKCYIMHDTHLKHGSYGATGVTVANIV